MYSFVIKKIYINLKITGSIIRDASHRETLKYVKYFEGKPNPQKINCSIIELYSHSELI